MQLKEIGSRISQFQNGGKIAVVTDTNVAPLYLDKCTEYLKDAGFQVCSFVIPAGEESKNGETFLTLLEGLAENNLTRSDSVVALGGGMIGDLAGFTAASYMRGIKVTQVPTTLLASVDSSIGGKTGIDLSAGKNLAGAFHMPSLVLQDTELLQSLPDNVFRDGMAEVIKTGVIGDSELFEKAADPDYVKNNLDEIVKGCAAIKNKIVAEDAKDNGLRQLLNLGHTIGHAIEKLSDFELSHGCSVAKGMNAIAIISAREGWCDESVPAEIQKALKAWDFELSIEYTAEQVFDVMKNDKKRRGDKIDLVIPSKIGGCTLRKLTLDELQWLIS